MARMLRESWRSDAPSSVDDARDRLIDAAETCFTRFGVAKTTLEDIATEAGVSRATVYRYFEGGRDERSEEHTSELQSLMRISYAVFCLKKKKEETKRATETTYH